MSDSDPLQCRTSCVCGPEDCTPTTSVDKLLFLVLTWLVKHIGYAHGAIQLVIE